MAEIEGLDFGLHTMGDHFRRQPIDKIGAVFIDAGREVV
jgi:hypothetical protein